MRTRELPRDVRDEVGEAEPLRPVALRAGAACRYLSISNSTLKRLEAAGEIPVVRLTRHKVYPVIGLDALIKRGMERLILKGRKAGRNKQLGSYA